MSAPSIDRVEELLDELLGGGFDDSRAFFRRQFDLGLAWVWFPPGLGGLGGDVSLQSAIDGRIREAGAPIASENSFIGVVTAAPLIQRYGTPDQKERLLQPLFVGDEIYCQLFSEPGAGSDLASLSTKATLYEGIWTVNGQKVWTTGAHDSTKGLLLARSSPERPKRQGITFFVVDMATPGVDVRPLMQLTGEAEFNEVFLADVAIPDSDRLGDRDGGWAVVRDALAGERAAIGDGRSVTGPRPMDQALIAWREGPQHLRTTGRRDRLMQLYIRWESLGMLTRRTAKAVDPTLVKVATSELVQATAEFIVELRGADGMIHAVGYPLARAKMGIEFRSATQFLLRTRSTTIGGGTSEVLRSMVAERTLGLPR